MYEKCILKIDWVRQIGKSTEEVLFIYLFIFAFGKSSTRTNFICKWNVFIIRPQAHINTAAEV